MKALNARFDGKNVVLDEPIALPPNTLVTVIIKEGDESDADIARWCAMTAQETFARIWDNPLDADYDKH